MPTTVDDPERVARRRSEQFKRVRDAHQTELAEDYVELIADLIEEKGEARLVDLSERLGVTKATVNNTIQRLQRDGFVTSQPYRAIFLTDKGRKLPQPHASATTSSETCSSPWALMPRPPTPMPRASNIM